MLDRLTDDLFTLDVPFSMMGLALGGRVTIARLPDGGLWVHSPVRLTPELKAAVDALGPVRHLVAPNLYHHIFVPDWAAAWPEARVHAPPGLEAKQKSLRIDRPLGADPDPDWQDAIAPVPLRGVDMVSETFFVHTPSNTAISADLAFAVPPAKRSLFTSLYMRLNGIANKPMGCSFLHKAATKDKDAARASIADLLERDWSRLVLAHCDVFDGPDVKDSVREAWSWVGV